MGLSRSSHDYLIIRGESGGLKREGGLNNFLSLEGGGGGGLNTGFMIHHCITKPVREQIASIFFDCATGTFT